MNLSMRKVKILCGKDCRDYFKNPNLLLSSLIPILFMIFYKFIIPFEGSENSTTYILRMGTLMNTTMCAALIVSSSIAEEKEKFTMRTLMLSNITMQEFFLSKILVGFSITVIANVIIFFISGETINHLAVYLICVILGSLTMIILSAVIGIMSRDQMTCGVYQVPLMLLFMMPPMFSGINKALQVVADLTPLNAMIEIYDRGIDGDWISLKMLFYFAVLLLWILGATILFAYMYRKKAKDN